MALRSHETVRRCGCWRVCALVVAAMALVHPAQLARAGEGAPAADSETVWVVTEGSGQATAAAEDRTALQHPLSDGDVLYPHQIVVTGADGSLTLAHGDDVLRMS